MYDLALLILTTRKVVELSNGMRPLPALRLILRDGTWSFFVTQISVFISVVYALTHHMEELLTAVE
jgi:hypothetical protein